MSDLMLNDIKKFASGDTAKTLLPAVRGTGVNQIMKHLVDLAGDLIPKEWKKQGGWKIEKRVGDGTLELDPSKLVLHFSPNQKDNKFIEGKRLRKELEKNMVPVLNACVLDYLIAHPEIIPEEWKVDEKGNTRYIYFWGTVYRRWHGYLCVRCLCWEDGVWLWRYHGLDRGWRVQSPAAILESVPQP